MPAGYLSTAECRRRIALLTAFLIMQRTALVTPSSIVLHTPPLNTYADVHEETLKQSIPAWVINASPAKRAALSRGQAAIADWYKTATPREHDTLKALVGAAGAAQNQVDQAMNNLLSPADFGAPLLQQLLKQRFGMDLDVRATYLRFYVPQTVPWFPIRTGAARTWTVSLLDAALHNFEAGEAFEAQSGFITQPRHDGQFEPLPTLDARISVAQFTALCRELDIGGRYQHYLDQFFDARNAVAVTRLRLKLDTTHKADLAVALQIAWMKKDLLDDQSFVLLQRLLSPQSGGKTGAPLQCYDLSIMSSTLTGIVLFSQSLGSRHDVPMIAYIPDDPYAPLKQYPSPAAFMKALGNNLRTVEYQQFFSRFIHHDERGEFFADLNHRLSRVTWHPHTRGDPLPTWRDTPIDNPHLTFGGHVIQGDLFQHLYLQKLNKVYRDAKALAVSTASVDQKVRWERWSVFQKIASTLLQIAAFIAAPFIPPIGLVMLGYTAYQMLDEAFEWIIDWAEGEVSEAFRHLLSFVEQGIQLGLFIAGAPLATGALRKLLPPEAWAFFERLKPVILPDGQARLWKPDLSPYAHDLTLAKHSYPNVQGLHPYNGIKVLPHAKGMLVVQSDPITEQPYLQHPSRPNAYRPPLTTNGKGAWLTELDRPLSWDSQTLMQRLGPHTQGLTHEQLANVRRISATEEGALRKMYATGHPPPALLLDTLERFKIDQGLQDFIRQMSSDDPQVYGQADIQTQLQLLTNLDPWPKTATLRVVDTQGQRLWEFAGDKQARVILIQEAQLQNGDLLHTLLDALDEPQQKALLGEYFGDPTLSTRARAANLRKKLAGLARSHRTELFESRYLLLDRPADARQKVLVDATPGLPASAAEAILHSANSEELQQLDQGTLAPRLAELAKTLQEQAHLNHTYEGLFLDAVDDLDTHRLALHSLERLPGWTGTVRMEIRRPAPASTLIDAIGTPAAPTLRTLIREPDGRYTPHDSEGPLFGQTDLYTAMLQALPDSERDALSLRIGQAPQLKQALAAHALERAPLKKLIIAHPAPPPRDTRTHLRLLGMDGYRAAPGEPSAGPSHRPSLEEQAQQLFPARTAEQISQLIHNLQTHPGGAQPRLTALKQEYQQLGRDLDTWVVNTPRLYPGTQVRISRSEYGNNKQNRHLWAQELRRCWRQETEVDPYFDVPERNGQVLSLLHPVSGELPSLRVRFDHVSKLEITGRGEALDVDTFLQLFPRLRHLSLRKIRLHSLPGTIGTWGHLNALILSECNITLTPISHITLTTLSRLRALDLYNNPLGLIPNIENLPELRDLDLSSTGITALPAGLLSRPQLELAVLSDNQISELPAAFFELPGDTRKEFDLSNNPLSLQTLEHVKAYFLRTGRHWDIDAPSEEVEQVNTLFPSFSTDEVNRLIFGLPGSLETGRVELARLHQQYQGLNSDLNRWVSSAASPEEQARRLAFQHSLQACWRRETPLDNNSPQAIPTYTLEHLKPIEGEFPPLDSVFSHVSALRLQGEDGPFPLHSAPFLRGFPTLNHLSIGHYTMGDIPGPLLELPQLTSLSLRYCALTLSADSAASLVTLDALDLLDLSHNALEWVPEFGRLPRLSRLNLEHTGLTQIPDSLLTPVARTQINLSGNRITQIPDAVFKLRPEVTGAFDLSRNPLTNQALAQVKRYCQRTGEHLKADPPTALSERIKALYPTFTDNEANRFFFELPGDLEAAAPAIEGLEREFHQLMTDLQQWALDIPTRHPILDVPLDAGMRAQEQFNRLAFKALLEEAWRRETELDETNGATTHRIVFESPLLGTLPELSARFDHVSLLELGGEGGTTNVDGLLQRFLQLDTLILSKLRLGAVPQRVFDMHRLTSLTLAESNLRLTAASADALSGMSTLRYLDLSENPLGITPDVSQLNQLESLYLQDTQISEIPRGLFELRELGVLDLSDNLITEIPADIIDLAPRLNGASDLSGNPLSVQSLEHLRQCYLLTGNDFGIREATQDAAGNPLVRPDATEPMEE